MPDASPPPEESPEFLDGRYEIVRELGEGGMGRVFEGIHSVLRRPVAIKVLSARVASDERSRKRLLREARAAAAVHHPNVVETIDFGQTPQGSVYLVMELLEGRDLRAILREQGALPWPRACEILRQAASALQAAHAQGIIHRDIKPNNCVILPVEDDPHGEAVEVVKLLDFGIAKVEDTAQSITGLTATGEIVGTATYMAPELTLGATAGVPTDIYSLGIMAYELLTGAPPFSGKNVYDIMRGHIEETPVPPSEHVAGLPPALEALVLRAIAKQPEERFESMTALEAALAELPMPTSTHDAPSPSPPPASRESSSGPTGTEVISLPSKPDPFSEEAPTLLFDATALRLNARLDAPSAPAPGHAAPRAPDRERPAPGVAPRNHAAHMPPPRPRHEHRNPASPYAAPYDPQSQASANPSAAGNHGPAPAPTPTPAPTPAPSPLSASADAFGPPIADSSTVGAPSLTDDPDGIPGWLAAVLIVITGVVAISLWYVVG